MLSIKHIGDPIHRNEPVCFKRQGFVASDDEQPAGCQTIQNANYRFLSGLLSAIGQDIVAQKYDVKIFPGRVGQQMVDFPVNIAFKFIFDHKPLGALAVFKKNGTVFNCKLFQAAEVINPAHSVLQISGMSVRGHHFQLRQ